MRLTPSKGRGECVKPSPARVVCSEPRELSFEGETIEQYLPVVVKAAETAKTGDTGTVIITFSAKGLAPITGRPPRPPRAPSKTGGRHCRRVVRSSR
jgi:hypothetical protein